MCSLELVPFLRLKKKCARPQNKIFPTSTPAVFIWESASPGRLFLSMTENLRKEIWIWICLLFDLRLFFLSIKSLSGQVVHRAGVYSGFLCFKRPGVYVLPEWNVYRKREGDLKYVTDLIVAFNLLEKRKQLSESYILQNATIICFGVIVQPLIFDITETRFLPFFEGLVIQYQSYCRICQQTFVRRSHSTDCTSMFIWGNG